MISFIKKYQLHYKVASLFAAILIWVYVVGVMNLETTTEITRIPVGFVGESVMMEERGLVLLSGKDQTVNLTLRGNRNSLVRISRENIAIEVNLDAITAPGSVNVTYNVLLPESGINIIDRSPSYITLKADKITTKSVPVKIAAQGSLPEDYSLGATTLDPAEITIEGPSEQLKDIVAAQVVIDITGAKNTLNRSLDYILVNQAGEQQNFPLVRHEGGQIGVTQRINLVKTLPLTVNVIEGGFALSNNVKVAVLPETVTVEGDPSEIAALSELNIGNVYLSDINKDITETELPIILPEDLRMVEGSTEAKVRIELIGISIRTFTVTQVRIKDQTLPENFQVKLPVMIELRGDADIIDGITGKDIWLEIVLGGIKPSPGTYTFASTVVIDGAYGGVSPTRDVTVSITVSEPRTAIAAGNESSGLYSPA